MHILFVHQNFPAQFGHIASYLVHNKGFQCSFVSQRAQGINGGIECIRYHSSGGAAENNHYCSRSFENAIWHSHAVFKALEARPDLRPDLVVAHSGFLSTVFLRELYGCPVINYFEYFYRTSGTDMDFRPDFPCQTITRLRALARNAAILLDLENCDIGYCPTRWQQGLFPQLFQPKLRTIFDGIDTTVWRPRPEIPRMVAGQAVPNEMRIVTYVARGMESIRGFDIFMRMAKLLCDRRKSVLFVVVGEDRVCYGGDLELLGQPSFKQWVLSQDSYDLSRFVFTGLLAPTELAALLAVSDLHVYLTVPFVLSWSLMNALACGATVLASNTAPVREVIQHDKNGLMVDFFDVEGLAEMAGRVLDAPEKYRELGIAGCKMIRERYSLDVCLPRLLALYEDASYSRSHTH